MQTVNQHAEYRIQRTRAEAAETILRGWVMEFIVLILIGLLSSILGSLVGIGGGVIVVPALMFFGLTLGLLRQ